MNASATPARHRPPRGRNAHLRCVISGRLPMPWRQVIRGRVLPHERCDTTPREPAILYAAGSAAHSFADGSTTPGRPLCDTPLIADAEREAAPSFSKEHTTRPRHASFLRREDSTLFNAGPASQCSAGRRQHGDFSFHRESHCRRSCRRPLVVSSLALD